MAESALEFLRIARTHDYHQMVLSMKSSNPKVMIEAYRLVVSLMNEEGWIIPSISESPKLETVRMPALKVRSVWLLALGWSGRHAAGFSY